MMSEGWPKVKLGEVLRRVERGESVEASSEYRLLGTRWYAQGLFIKERKLGQEIRASKLYRVQSGDFVYNRLFAWKGSFAIADADAHGCYVSNEFPCFQPQADRVEPRFLKWWFSREAAWLEALGLSTGATPTSRNRLKETHLLSMEIPLPPLSEQRRVVGRIEEVAGRIEEARRLHTGSSKEAAVIVQSSVAVRCFNSFNTGTLGEILASAKNGIYKPPDCWGRGIPCIRMYNIDGPELNQNRLQLLDVTSDDVADYGCLPGDLIFNRVNSAELVGKTGIVRDGFPMATFESKNMRLRVDRSKALPEFAALILNSPQVRSYYQTVLKQQCGMATLNQTHVRNIPFPNVDIANQRRIVADMAALQRQSHALGQLQSDASAYLDALLPSVLDKAFRGEL